MLRLMRDLLSALSVKYVTGAHDAEDALTRLRDNPIDLLISDINLGGVDGIDLTRRIRAGADGVSRALPVLLTVAMPTIGRIHEARDAGVDEVLLKPLCLKGLEKKISLAALHTRNFVMTGSYAGPDRRRPSGVYRGPLRRKDDRPGGDILI